MTQNTTRVIFSKIPPWYFNILLLPSKLGKDMKSCHSLFPSGRPQLSFCASKGDFSFPSGLGMRELEASPWSELKVWHEKLAAHLWTCLGQQPFILIGSVENNNLRNSDKHCLSSFIYWPVWKIKLICSRRKVSTTRICYRHQGIKVTEPSCPSLSHKFTTPIKFKKGKIQEKLFLWESWYLLYQP